jgi:hypothetical protein
MFLSSVRVFRLLEIGRIAVCSSRDQIAATRHEKWFRLAFSAPRWWRWRYPLFMSNASHARHMLRPCCSSALLDVVATRWLYSFCESLRDNVSLHTRYQRDVHAPYSLCHLQGVAEPFTFSGGRFSIAVLASACVGAPGSDLRISRSLRREPHPVRKSYFLEHHLSGVHYHLSRDLHFYSTVRPRSTLDAQTIDHVYFASISPAVIAA